MGKDQELLEAARNGNVPVVEKILSQRAKRSGPLASLRRGPGANVQDSSGYSCLHHAALNGHSEVVRLLLEHDASTNIVDCRGSSPLHLAAWTGNVDIVRQLLSGPIITNVNLTTKDSETALHSAAQYGHTAVVEQLLDNVCDPAIRNIRGETALDLAAQYGRLETVELLLHRHRELIQPMRRAVPGILFPHTPLHLASRNGHKGVVEILLAAGFDVNIRTAAGTALTEAAICGKVEVVRTLLDHGADLSVRDAHGNTVMDLLAQFPAQATQEITSVIRRYFRSNGSLMGDSDIDESLSLSQPFPPVPEGENSLGSPYENVRPTSRGRSLTAESVSPSTSPSRWDYYRQSRSVDMCEDRDRRVSGASAMSITRKHRIYKSMPIRLKPRAKKRNIPLPTITINNNTRSPTVLDSVTFSFSQQCTLLDARLSSEGSSSTSSYKTTSPNSFRGSDNSVYQTPPAPKSFMDCSVHSEDLSFSVFPEADQVSLSSTASSCGYRDRRLDSGSAPLYLPMNRGSGHSGHSGHSPGSNSKVSPTPPKKPPRRNLSVSPTHLQPMSVSAEGVGNPAYEYLYLARSGARSQSDLDEIDGGKSDTERRREQHHHLRHGRSVDAYVEMNCVFSLGADEIDEPLPPSRELQRGKSEDLDSRRVRDEPVAISAMYENTIIKAQNPRRKLRRHHDRADTTYEQYDFASPVTSSSAPDTNYVSSAFLTIKSSQENLPGSGALGGNSSAPMDRPEKKVVKLIHIPMSPTHYQQPPTPEHPPPSALQAEKSIHERIRPLSQEYKRRSKDMETETEEEYLIFPCDESSGSLSSSISLSDKSVSTDNNVEEFVGDVPFAGLLKGSTKVLDNLSTPRPIPAERPKTLRKLKHVYENANGGGMAKSEDLEVVTQRKISSRGNNSTSSSSSGTVVCTANGDKDKSLSILSPFDEQEEWAKIQEIMASFGTGLVRESVFVTELEKEFQTRLMSMSQSHMAQASNASTVEKWLSNLGLSEYESLFMNSGFDDLDFLNGVLENNDLREMGITSEAERQLVMDAARQLPAKVQEQAPCNNNNIDEAADTVDQWLRRIHLDCYTETFSKHLYLDMDRIRRIWDVELSAVLDIEKIGHRKRILASVSGGDHITPGPKLEDINADLNMLNTNIQQLKDDIKSSSPANQQSSTTSSSNGTTNTNPSTNTNTNTGTLRHRHKKSRPAPPPPVQVPGSNGVVHDKPEKLEKPKSEAIEIRAPSELRLGAGTPLRAQWRHKPLSLITGAVQYIANYLGSTVIKELRGMESTRKSIQKLKKTSTNVKPTPEIILSISYRGVKFLNTITQILVCEHEIRNIQCVCQDPDDLTHFAYITKDHATKKHYCHVFSSPTTDQATEIILTLGQAFEVAYQMALREQVTSRSKKNSQAYNHPARSPGSVSSKSKDCGKESPPSSRARSHSASDIKLNGHQLKMTPMSLSTEPFGNDQPSERTPTKGHLSFVTEDAKVTETAV